MCPLEISIPHSVSCCRIRHRPDTGGSRRPGRYIPDSGAVARVHETPVYPLGSVRAVSGWVADPIARLQSGAFPDRVAPTQRAGSAIIVGGANRCRKLDQSRVIELSQRRARCHVFESTLLIKPSPRADTVPVKDGYDANLDGWQSGLGSWRDQLRQSVCPEE